MWLYILLSLTSLFQLRLAEFTMKKVQLSVYNKILGLCFFLIFKVKQSAILIFKVIFLCQKSAESLQIFFIEEFKKGRPTFIYEIFHNFDFQCTFFSKMTVPLKWCPIFDLKIEKNQRPRKYLYTPSWSWLSWGQPYSSLSPAKLSWKSEVTLILLNSHKIWWRTQQNRRSPSTEKSLVRSFKTRTTQFQSKHQQN